jgi:hypothetical protein
VANAVVNPTIVAKAAVRILDNELVAAGLVHRAHEADFAKTVNGYKPGSTITIRKPTQFTVRDGAVASAQDVVEGTTSITINKQKGVDFKFSSTELTLNIGELSERVIRPAMIQIANQIDRDVLSLYKDVYNYVGTPGTSIASFAAMARAAERFDLSAVPQDGRASVLSPTDGWAIAASQTALYMQNMASKAYRTGSIGEIAGLSTNQSQNVQTHTFGPRGGTPLVNGAAQNVAYTAAKDTTTVPGSQSLITDGWTAAAASRVKQGDVFTIANVYAVNPVTKAVLPYLQQFTVLADGSSDGSGNLTLSIAPAIITSGAFQTVDSAPADNAALTFVGTASAGVASNLAFKKEAFALCVVPLEMPNGAVNPARESYKGISVRVIPYYDGTNDVSNWRLDVLYGVKTLDPRLACRLGG